MVHPAKFGDLLKRHRLAEKLTQKGLAIAAEVSAAAIALYEQGGGATPKRSTARKLAGALHLGGVAAEAFLVAANPNAIPGLERLIERLTNILEKPRVPRELTERLERDLDELLSDFEQSGQAVRWALLPIAGWQSQLLNPLMTARLIRQATAEASAAGIDRIMLIVTPTQQQELPRHLGVLPDIRTVRYVVQREQKGFGHALLMAHGEGLQRETVCVITPDETIDPSCLRAMVELHANNRLPVAAVRLPGKTPHHLYGVVRGGLRTGIFHVKELAEKPKTTSRKGWILLGRYILPPLVFEELAATSPNPRTGNIELTDALQSLIDKKHELLAHVHTGRYNALTPSLVHLFDALEKLDGG